MGYCGEFGRERVIYSFEPLLIGASLIPVVAMTAVLTLVRTHADRS